MKWIITSGLVLAAGIGLYQFLPGDADDRRLVRAIGTYECPPAPDAPSFGTAYEGPLIDTHMHIPHPPEGPEIVDAMPFSGSSPELGRSITVSNYICNFKTEGIIKAFIFFPVYPGLEDLHLAVVNESMKKYAEFLVPFIMPPDRDDALDGYPTVSVSTLREWLEVYPRLFKGFGEIGLYERRNDNGEQVGSAELLPDSERLQKIYPVIREYNLLVYFHLGEGQREAYERTLSLNPDINFVFHGDQLVKTDNQGNQDLSAIEEILYRHPNTYYGVDELWGDVWILHPDKSREEFFAHFENNEELLEEDVKTWKGFIERHSDQALWGSDRGVANLWTMDRDVGLTLTGYVRAFISRLDTSVQEKFAYKNAEKLLLGR